MIMNSKHVKGGLNSSDEAVNKTNDLLFNSYSIDEEWPRLHTNLNKAISEKNESNILSIMRRIGDAFPEQLTNAIINEMKPLIKTVKELSKKLNESESKTRTIKIIDLWNKKLNTNGNDLQDQRQKMDEQCKKLQISSEKNKFEENKKPINLIDATKSVPGKFRRNK